MILYPTYTPFLPSLSPGHSPLLAGLGKGTGLGIGKLLVSWLSQGFRKVKRRSSFPKMWSSQSQSFMVGGRRTNVDSLGSNQSCKLNC